MCGKYHEIHQSVVSKNYKIFISGTGRKVLNYRCQSLEGGKNHYSIMEKYHEIHQLVANITKLDDESVMKFINSLQSKSHKNIVVVHGKKKKKLDLPVVKW